MSMITGLTAVAVPALKLIAGAIDKKDSADVLNRYIDRGVDFDELFDKDQEKAEAALTRLYGDIVRTLAGKGITASPWWRDGDRDAPCLKIPVSTIRELLDAATR